MVVGVWAAAKGQSLAAFESPARMLAQSALQLQGQQGGGAARLPLGRVSTSRLNVMGSPGAAPDKAGAARSARMSLGPGTLLPRVSLGTRSAKKLKQQRMSMMPTMGLGGSVANRENVPGYLAGGGAAALAAGGNNGSNNNNNTRRMSTMSSSRRRSTATSGGGLAGPLKSDPRPLGDKAFTRQSIESLIEFLVQHNYDQAISPKVLHRPTGKDFENVILFLFGLLDPHRARGGAGAGADGAQASPKFADEVTGVFKGLRYPFNISKTALAAVGSPHTWPALLASLTWLVELLEYSERAGLESVEYETLPAEELDSDKQFFVYLRRAYACFLAGDDAGQDALDREREQLIVAEQAAMRDASARVRRAKEQLGKQLAEEQAAPPRVPELEQRKRDFQSDRLKWDKLIQQFEENREVMQSKLREREKECRDKEQELAQQQLAREHVQQQLDQQELSPQGVERMTQERRHLEEAINRALEARDETQQKVWALEMAIAQRAQRADQTLEQYNATAKALRLVGGASVLLRLDPVQRLVVPVDPPAPGQPAQPAAAIRAALETLATMSKAKVHQVRTESMELRTRVEQNEEEQAALRREIEAAQARVRAAEETHDTDRAAMEAELASRAADTEAVEEEIHHLQAAAAALQQPALEARLREEQLRAQLERERAQHEQALTLVDEELGAAMESCCSFQEHTSATIAALESELRDAAKRAHALAAERLAAMRALADAPVDMTSN